jgi:hypothetical protein
MVRVEELRPSKVLAGSHALGSSAFQSLKASGPFSAGECPADPTVLFVFPQNYRDQANRLFLALKNGVGPFPGVERLFKFRLATSRVQRLTEFALPVADSHGHRAQAYVDAIEAEVKTLHPKPDIALVIHPKTDAFTEDNPYLAAKFHLLKSNIPTQIVTADLIDNAPTLQWSAANIALAMFAKMGGKPWAIDTGLSPDSLIVGINRAFVSGPKQNTKTRVFGFATTFSYNGVYLETTLFPLADTWDSYLKALKRSLNELIVSWHRKSGAPVPLVFHVQKDLHREEVAIIEECLAAETSTAVKEYSVIRLADGDGMLIVDDATPDSMTPRAGTLVYLSGHRVLLQVSGQSSGPTVGKVVTSGPLQLTNIKSSPAAPKLSLLAQHAMALAQMNWSGFNSEAWPVSIEYPRRLADLLGRFSAAGLDVRLLEGVSAMARPWFL